MAKAQGKNAAVDAIDDGMRENMIAVRYQGCEGRPHYGFRCSHGSW